MFVQLCYNVHYTSSHSHNWFDDDYLFKSAIICLTSSVCSYKCIHSTEIHFHELWPKTWIHLTSSRYLKLKCKKARERVCWSIYFCASYIEYMAFQGVQRYNTVSTAGFSSSCIRVQLFNHTQKLEEKANFLATSIQCACNFSRSSKLEAQCATLFEGCISATLLFAELKSIGQ